MCWIATGLLLLCSQKVGELSVSCLLAQIHRAFRFNLEPDWQAGKSCQVGTAAVLVQHPAAWRSTASYLCVVQQAPVLVLVLHAQ